MRVTETCGGVCEAACACFRDPEGTTLAFADMMKKQIVMPAHMMDDMVHKGRTGRNIFQDFSTVAESTGTYTAQVIRLLPVISVPAHYLSSRHLLLATPWFLSV